MEEKDKYDKQIKSIIKIIQNSDNQQIQKIAFETILNKFLENPQIFYIIIENFISLSIKGNVRIIEEFKFYLKSMLDEIDEKLILKILNSEIIKEGLLKIIKSNELNDDDLIFSVNTSSEPIIIKEISEIVFEKAIKYDELMNIENLYSEKLDEEVFLDEDNQEGDTITAKDLNILFPNKDQFKTEIENSFVKGNGNTNKSQKKTEKNVKLLKITDFIKKFSINHEINKFEICEKNQVDKRIKKRKIQTDNHNVVNVTHKKAYFSPFLLLTESIISLNSNYSWKTRMCSSYFLNEFAGYFENLVLRFIKISINISKEGEEFILIDSITIDDFDTKYNEHLKKILSMNLFSRLFINSFIDKVIDFNDEPICPLKELNLKISFKLNKMIKDYINNTEFLMIFLKIMNYFDFSLKEFDWQPAYCILILLKEFQDFNNEIFIENKEVIIEILHKIMECEIEDIINLTIQILEKIIVTNSVQIINKTGFFIDFLNLIKRYDDIDTGVIYYFRCLVKFINIIYEFKFEKNKITEVPNIIINKIQKVIDENLISYSFNKMSKVRTSYFEIVTKIMLCIQISDKVLEDHFLLAFQGLCIEENKEILVSQQNFLAEFVNNDKFIPLLNSVLKKNSKRIFNLLLIHNLNNLKYFYFPKKNDEEDFEESYLYSSFFVNDLQKSKIQENYEKKLRYLLPIFGLMLSKNLNSIEFIEKYICDFNNFTISSKTCLLLRIYLFYLEFLETKQEKTLIINDDDLNNLTEQKFIDFVPLLVDDENEEFVSMIIKLFIIDFQKELNLLKESNKKIYEDLKIIIENINNFYLSFTKSKLLNLKEIQESLEKLYEVLKNSQNVNLQTLVVNASNNLKNFESNFSSLKINIRCYSACCLIYHNYYKNMKNEKVSNKANAFINALKVNSKEMKILSKYFLRLIVTLNNDVSSKILTIFFDNSISGFEVDIKQKLSKIIDNSPTTINQKINILTNEVKESQEQFLSRTKYYPLKYFFQSFAFYPYNITIFIQSYFNFELIKNNQALFSLKLKNYFYFIFLVSKLKLSTRFFNLIDFMNYLQLFVPLHKDYFDSEFFINILSEIFKNQEKCFYLQPKEDLDNKVLTIIFNEIKSENLFYFFLVEKLFLIEKFQIKSIKFTLEILSKISHKTKEIRTVSVRLFSKMMKVVSMLKLDKRYEDLVEKENTKSDFSEKNTNESLSFIRDLFNQSNQENLNLNFELKQSLRSYQITGVKWLNFIGKNSLGAALCDDMGLGKTIQTLVSIVNESINFVKSRGKNPLSIIICPNTLVLNWINEANKFISPSICRFVQFSQGVNLNKDINSPLEIYISSYDFIRDFDFSNLEFFYAVLDEAHIIKNPKSKIYLSVKKIVSERRIILTGTPIQNNVMELWALFDFLMPGFLGTENDFEINYQKKIQTNIKKLNLEEKIQENIFQASLNEIRKRIRPFILRRIKTDVLKELPEKIISDYICELTPVQQKIYNYLESCEMKQGKNNASKISSFENIDKLKKACNFPNFILNTEDAFNILSKLNLSKEEEMNLRDYSSSAKLLGLEDIFLTLNFDPQLNSQSTKVLIFAQGNKSLNIVEDFIKKKFSFLKTKQFSSELSQEKRMELVEEFNLKFEIDVLLLTTSIGGLGLSLTTANIVIMFDHDWNPTKDLQAMDRAHRIGQTKTVQVFRLITSNTIEERQISLQTFKQYISNNIVSSNQISDSNLNIGSFMESLEHVNKSGDKKTTTEKSIRKKGKKSE